MNRPTRVRIGGAGSRDWRWMIPGDSTMYATKAAAQKALDTQPPTPNWDYIDEQETNAPT